MTHRTQDPDPGMRVATFPSTHWSVIIQAGDDLDAERAQSLEVLCRTYWQPLYTYVRRKGYAPADAEDLTQEFLRRFLEKNYLSSVDAKKGRFRSFLLASLEHFLAKEWNRAHRVKRGGRYSFIAFDEQMRELDSPPQLSPEAAYDRSWALKVLQQTMERLEADYSRDGKAALFDALKVFLTGDRDEKSYSEAAARLGLSNGAARVAVHRLRGRYGELLREVIAETVVRQEEIDEEIHHLLAALGG